MTQFEKHMRAEIEKQAKRVRVLEASHPSYEAESRMLKSLVKVFDEYRRLRASSLVNKGKE